MYRKIIPKLAVLVFFSILATGAYYYFNAKTVYESELVCAFNTLKKRIFGEMVHDLGKLAQARSYNSLAKILNIKLGEANTIVSIEGRDIAGAPLYKADYNDENSPIYILVRTTDVNVFNLLQKSLPEYLNNGPFLSKRRDMESTGIHKRIGFMNEDIKIIDSIISSHLTMNCSKLISFNGSGASVGRYPHSFLSDTTISSANIISLLALRDNLKEKLLGQEWRLREIAEPVEVLHGFVLPDHPSNNRMVILYRTIACAMLSLLLFAIIMIIIPHNEELRSKAGGFFSKLLYLLRP